jgi:osmoprotectant transport system ATP-binding protein
VIAFEHVSRDFVGQDGRVVHAVRDVSLELRAGETLCLIGTSGSGKTTLLRLVNRLLEPTSGRVLVAGRDVREAEPIALRRGLGWVIQSGGLFPHMSVARNVGLLCELSGWEPARVRSRVDELLELVHLPPGEYAARRPAELSGGQRQRVGVARALALDPPVVLMDEPFGALDPITRARLRAEFRELRARVAKTVLFVTHDMREAFELGDRVALLDAGRLVQVGTERDFRERPAAAFVTEFLRAHFDEAPGRA